MINAFEVETIDTWREGGEDDRVNTRTFPPSPTHLRQLIVFGGLIHFSSAQSSSLSFFAHRLVYIRTVSSVPALANNNARQMISMIKFSLHTVQVFDWQYLIHVSLSPQVN